MSIHKHKAHTKSDRLIAAMEALTAQIAMMQVALTSIQGQVSDVDQRVALLSAKDASLGAIVAGSLALHDH